MQSPRQKLRDLGAEAEGLMRLDPANGAGLRYAANQETTAKKML
jgi:hypothetical protein